MKFKNNIIFPLKKRQSRLRKLSSQKTLRLNSWAYQFIFQRSLRWYSKCALINTSTLVKAAYSRVSRTVISRITIPSTLVKAIFSRVPWTAVCRTTVPGRWRKTNSQRSPSPATEDKNERTTKMLWLRLAQRQTKIKSKQQILKQFNNPKSWSSNVALYCAGISIRAERAKSVSFLLIGTFFDIISVKFTNWMGERNKKIELLLKKMEGRT